MAATNAFTASTTMTPRQADRAIKSGKPVTLHNARFNETFVAVIVGRDRYTVTTSTGGRFERNELVMLPENVNSEKSTATPLSNKY